MPEVTPNISNSDTDVVTDDRTCRKCDYPLRGLSKGGVCPECGAPIPRRSVSLPHGDNLTDAPAKYLRQLSFGLGFLALSGVVFAFAFSMLKSSTTAIGPALLGLGAFMWVGSVWIVTIRRPMQDSTVPDRSLDDPKWILAIRLTQLIWLLAAFFGGLRWVAIDQGWTGAIGPARVGMNVCVLLSFVATVPVLAYLGTIAQWAGDEPLSGRLQGSAWGIVLGGVFGVGIVLVSPIFGPIAAVVWLIGVMLVSLLVLGVGVAFISMVQIAALSMEAISTNQATHARNIRVAQKRAESRNKVADRQLQANMPTGIQEIPIAEPAVGEPSISNTPTYKVNSHRIEKTDSGETYDLAPEED